MDIAFVTGATGFVGANVARTLLGKGFSVRVLARKDSNRKNLAGLSLDVVEGDVHHPASLLAACRGARYVFHAAADYRIWVTDPESMLATNVQGTLNVLEAAAKAGAERIVHCSSVAAVRPLEDGRPADESSEYSSLDGVVSPYKKSKWLSERAVLARAREGLPVVIVNPAAPIGPYDIKPTPTGRIVVDFLNGRIPSYIDTGLNVVHAYDVAEGHYQAAVRGRIGERYILGGENLTLKRILELLAETTGLAGPKFKTPYPIAYAFAVVDTFRARAFGGEPIAPLDAVRMAGHYMYYDSSKAKRELGFTQTPAREALRDAVQWFLTNGYVKDGRTVETITAHLKKKGGNPEPLIPTHAGASSGPPPSETSPRTAVPENVPGAPTRG